MAEAELIINESVRDGKCLLALSGDIDAKTAPLLREAIEKAVSGGKYFIVLDFMKVSYISSAGIGVLNATLGLAKGKGGDIVLSGVGKVIRDTLEVMYFTKKVRLFPGVEEAIKAL